MENQQLVKASSQPQMAINFFDPVQFDTVQRVCRLFAYSELVPDMYKVTDKNSETKAIANCMVAIEMAFRIGASPLAVMQNMIIIYGRPSWSSKFLVATVNTCGRFNPLQYRFTEKGMLGNMEYIEYVKGQGAKLVKFDGTKIMDVECIAYTTQKGSDTILESSPISVRLAVQEGWYTKSGSKWKTMTRQMLMYRAASFWTNVYAPELSMGMKTDDEIRDIEDVTYEDVTEKVDREKADKANKEGLGDIPVDPKQEKPDDETPKTETHKQGENVNNGQKGTPNPGF